MDQKMCPSVPVSVTTEDIGFNWPGGLLVMCLERMICGDPIPANVYTEINPYIDSPWMLNDSIWYFHSEDPKASETGYWMEAEEDREIYTDSPTIGSRSTLQFFSGQAPNGEKTNWMIHAYRIQQKRLLEINKEENSSSLCRVFSIRGQSPNSKEEEHGSGECDAKDNNTLLNSTKLDNNLKHPTIKSQTISKNDEHGSGECDAIDNIELLNSTELDNNLKHPTIKSQTVSKNDEHGSGECDAKDNNSLLNSTELDNNLKHPTIKSQVISTNDEHGLMKVSGRNLRQPSPDNSTDDFNEIFDFSRGDYLELEDLDDPLESSSSSSENSMCSTIASSEHFEYFDSSALLRDLENDLDTQRNYTDNIFGLLRPIHAAVRGDSSGAEQQLLDTETLEDVRNRQNVGDRDMNELINSSQDEVASSSSSNSNGTVQATTSQTLLDCEDDVAGRSRSRSRMAKLRKKYLCFMPC